MAEELADLIQIRRDTSNNWDSANPVLDLAEVGIIYADNVPWTNTSPVQFKVGDGVHTWSELELQYASSFRELTHNGVSLEQVNGVVDIPSDVSGSFTVGNLLKVTGSGKIVDSGKKYSDIATDTYNYINTVVVSSSVSSSYAQIADSSSHADEATEAVSASYVKWGNISEIPIAEAAVATASRALVANQADSVAWSAVSNVPTNAFAVNSASFAQNSFNATSASFATTANNATLANQAQSALAVDWNNISNKPSKYISASHADQAISASSVTWGGISEIPTDREAVVTASFALLAADVEGGMTWDNISGIPTTVAAVSSSSYATYASQSILALTASYVDLVVTGSIESASFATYAATAGSSTSSSQAAHANNADQATSSSYATVAGNVSNPIWESNNKAGAVLVGENGTAAGSGSVVIGSGSSASGRNTVAEGWYTLASGDYSHAEGFRATASSAGAHAEGSGSQAAGNYSHAEGHKTEAGGHYAHAEGNGTVSTGQSAHSEGEHARGFGQGSHAEGTGSLARGSYSHAEGYLTTAYDNGSHAEGSGSYATGQYAHAEGILTETYNDGEHAEGRFNKSTKTSATFGNAGNTQHSIGIGASAVSRSNAVEVMQNGDVYVKGIGGYDGTNATSQTTKTLQASLGLTTIPYISMPDPSGIGPGAYVASSSVDDIPTILNVSDNIWAGILGGAYPRVIAEGPGGDDIAFQVEPVEDVHININIPDPEDESAAQLEIEASGGVMFLRNRISSVISPADASSTYVPSSDCRKVGVAVFLDLGNELAYYMVVGSNGESGSGEEDPENGGGSGQE